MTEDKISSKHIFFIILGTTIISPKTYVTLFTNYVGRDSWITMLIAVLLITLFISYMLTICRKNNNYDFVSIYKVALGSGWGIFGIILYGIGLFFVLLECTSVYSNAMHNNLLIDTPNWAFILFMVLICLYTINKGFYSAMIVTIIGITAVTISGINLAILTHKYKKFRYLLPILAEGINNNVFISVLRYFSILGLITVLFPYLVNVNDKKNLKKNIIYSFLFAAQIQIVALIGTLTTFVPERLTYIYFPKLVQTQLVSYFDFLEAGDLFVMLQVVVGWHIKYLVTFFALLKLLKNININFKWTPHVISIFVFAISYFISSDIFKLFNMLNYYIYLVLIMFIIIPFVVFTIYRFRSIR